MSTTALCPLNHPKTRLTRTTTSGAEMDQNEDIGRNRQNGSSDPANAHRSSSWSFPNKNPPAAGLYSPYRVLNGNLWGLRGPKWRFLAVAFLLNLPATQPVRELVTKLIKGFR